MKTCNEVIGNYLSNLYDLEGISDEISIEDLVMDDTVDIQAHDDYQGSIAVLIAGGEEVTLKDPEQVFTKY